MAGSDYSSYTSSVGFWGGLLSGLGGLFGGPVVQLPTRPNPQSQVLVATNAGEIYDAGSPTGKSYADLWYDPISSVPGSIQSIQGYEPVQTRDPYTGKITVTQRAIYGPKMYMVKSQSPEQAQIDRKLSDSEQIFRSPEAAAINQSPCVPAPSNVAATQMERVNRLTMNQFLSPFRARRLGGNSYQALSEPQDNIFSPTGKAGDFADNNMPDFIQSRQQQRIFRG